MTLLDRARELLSDVLLHRAMRDMPAMNAALDQLEELLLPEHARELRAAAPDLTDAERRILQHATAWPKRYRNHYTTGPDCDNWAQLRALVARGLMRVSRGPDDIFGGMSVFQVTEAGFAALSAAAISGQDPESGQRGRGQGGAVCAGCRGRGLCGGDMTCPHCGGAGRKPDATGGT